MYRWGAWGDKIRIGDPQRKKLLVIGASLKRGGAERMLIKLANNFAEKGFQVHFAVLYHEDGYRNGLSPKVALHPLDSPRPRLGLVVERKIIKSITQTIDRIKPDALLSSPDMVNVYTIKAVNRSKWKCRVVVREANNRTIREKNVGGILARTLRYMRKHSIGRAYLQSDGIVAISEGLRTDIVEYFGIPGNRIDVIYNPACPDTESLTATKTLKLPIHLQNRKLVICVANFKKQKDHTTLIYAWSRVIMDSGVHLLLAGEGPEREKIRKLVEKLGLERHVTFLGNIDDVFAWIKVSDVLVLSSRWEGFGNVLVEGLAFGKTVVATDCKSGPAEILGDGKFGYLAPVGDVKELAKQIYAAIQFPIDPGVCLQRAKDFSVDSAAKKYLNALVPGSVYPLPSLEQSVK